MRKYEILEGDNLEDIATWYYKVSHTEEEQQKKRLEKVVNALKRKNPEITEDSVHLPVGQTIILPSVWGIRRRAPETTRLPWRNTRYFLLWLLPIVLFMTLALTQPFWSRLIAEWVQNRLYGQEGILSSEALFDWARSSGLEWIFQPLATPLASVSKWAIVWSLVVFSLWLFFTPISDPPYLRARIRYLVLWAIGLIVLLALLSTALQAIVPSATLELTMLTDFGPLLAVWTTVVFLLFVYIGDSSPSHQRYFGQYQSLWTSLLVVILLIFLVSYSAYQDTRERVDGLLAVRMLANRTVYEVKATAENAEKRAGDLARNIEGYRRYIQFYESRRGEPTSDEPTSSESDAELLDRRKSLLTQLSNDLPILKQYAEGSLMKAQASLDQINIAMKQAGNDQRDGSGTSLAQTKSVISETIKSLELLPPALKDIDQEIDLLNKDPDRPLTHLEDLIRSGVIVPADEAGDKARIAYGAIIAVNVTVLASFLWVGALYTIFVLFPWILLFLFLFRKRDDRAGQILEDLRLLDPEEGLLRRILPSDTAPHEAVRGLATQAFSNFEYVLSLLLLSAIVAVGWYYIFYPAATLGLAQHIQAGPGIWNLTKYLVEKIRPLTAGFVGAYFYLMQMLYRRYRDSDLYPTAFLQSSERLLRVFILSLVLSFLAPLANWVNAIMCGFAFLAGIYPRTGLRWIATFVNQNTSFDFPETIEDAPLTQLSGLNIWHEARLLEENVENVDGMAEAPIERLVLRTHFSASQIVDWIDQATLYKHAGDRGEWFRMFRASGVRTATDLLDRVGLSLFKSEDLEKLRQDDFAPTLAKLRDVVAAVNAAQDCQLSAQERADEIAEARAKAKGLSDSAVLAADLASQTYTLAQTLRQDKPETYDRVFALNQKVEAALKAAQEANTSSMSVAMAAEQLQTGDVKQNEAKDAAVAEIKTNESVALAEQVAQLIQPMTRKPDSLTKLDEAKKRMDRWGEECRGMETQIQALLAFAEASAKIQATQTAADALHKEGIAAQGLLTTVREAITEARELASSLDVTAPETLDELQKLGARVAQVQELAGKLTDECTELSKAAKAISLPGARKATVTSALSAAEKGVATLKTTANEAHKATQPLTVDAVLTLKGLDHSQTAIKTMHEAAQEARSMVETAVVAVQVATEPARFTLDILKSICDCIWPANNMAYVVNFYAQSGQRLVTEATATARPAPGVARGST